MVAIVTELTVDARGVAAGEAVHATAMRKMKADTEAYLGTNAKAQAAIERQTSLMLVGGGAVDKHTAAFNRMRAAVDPLAKAQLEFSRAQTVVDNAMKRGIATTEEAARVLDLYRVRAQQAAGVSMPTPANSNAPGGLARHELVNLGRQAQDVGTMLAMGQSPMSIVTSQAAQVADIFMSSQGSVRGFFSQLASGAASVLTPLRLVTGGVAAIGITSAVAAMDFNSSMRDMERSLLGIGRAAGVTAQQANALALANAARGRMTVGEGRDVLGAFAGTGRIRGDMMGQALGVTKDLSITLGQDLAATGQLFAQALADPARNLDTLNARLAAFDATTVKHIRSLQDQGKLLDAQQRIIAGVRESVAGADLAVSGWTRVWDRATAAASGYWAVVGEGAARLTGGNTLEEQLKGAREELEKLEKLGKLGPLTEWLRSLAGGAATIDDVRAKVERLNTVVNNRASAAARTQGVLDSAEYERIAAGLAPDDSKLKLMRDQLTRLQQIQRGEINPYNRPRTSFDFVREDELVRRQQQQIAAAETTYQREQRQYEERLREIRARTPQQRAALAAEQAERDALQGGRVSASRARELGGMAGGLINAEAQQQMTEFQRQQLLQGRQQIEQQRMEIMLVDQSVGGVTRLRTEHQMLAQAQQEAFRTGIPVAQGYKDAVAKIADEMGRLAEATARARLGSDLGFERAQLGRSSIDQAVYSRMQGAGLLENGQIVGAQNEATAAQIRMNEQLKIGVGLAQDFGTGMFSDMRRGASAIDALGNALARVGDQIANMMIRDGISSMLGLGKGGAGMFGGDGLLSSIFSSFLPAPGAIFARGGAFGRGGVHAFAQGDIVTRPTLFRFANGGTPATGVMGEAGDEGIFPLRRNSRGQLGVMAAAKGNQPAPIHLSTNLSIDARGSNLTEAQIRAIVGPMLQRSQEETLRAVPMRMHQAQRGKG